MRNPWVKKNPFMSLWLTAANKAVGTARGKVAGASSAARRQVTTEASRQIADFWTGRPAAATKRRKSR